MKLIRAAGGQFSFQLDRSEKKMLLQVLRLYPLIPVAHHRLSRTEERREDQQMLEEAVAAQRLENRKQLRIFLAAKNRFEPDGQGHRFTLRAGQAEWLLQVLNDVRVGAWLALGSPERQAEMLARLNEKTAPYLWAMDVSGHFQMALLQAMSKGE